MHKPGACHFHLELAATGRLAAHMHVQLRTHSVSHEIAKMREFEGWICLVNPARRL